MLRKLFYPLHKQKVKTMIRLVEAQYRDSSIDNRDSVVVLRDRRVIKSQSSLFYFYFYFTN